MRPQRAIHAKLVLDRKDKRDAVVREYWAWQRQLQGCQEDLYSATKQQAERFRRRIRKQNHRGPDKNLEYPVILRRDCLKLEEKPTSIFKWWLRLPLHPVSAWVPIQFPVNQESLMKLELRESNLIRGGDRWFVNVTVQKEARLKQRYVTILPVDVGIRKLATTIDDGKSVAPHRIVKAIKGRSSNMLRKEFPEHCKLCVEAQSKK